MVQSKKYASVVYLNISEYLLNVFFLIEKKKPSVGDTECTVWNISTQYQVQNFLQLSFSDAETILIECIFGNYLTLCWKFAKVLFVVYTKSYL